MEKDIAIIGMSGRFPDADSIAAFYDNLCKGRDSVQKMSLDRVRKTNLSLRDEYQIGGYLSEIDTFDHSYFNLSKGEAETMDPSQRLFMEVVCETFESSGYSVDYFGGTNTSVFIGDTSLQYHEHAEEFDPTLLTGNLNAALAGKVSRFFDLRGSALMIDTTCSSALVALHHAIRELRLEETDQAIVGGVNLVLFPNLKEQIEEAGVFSPDGKARAFDASAEGTAIGEMVGCVLLKPLTKALAHKDNVLAVIKGSAVNQDAQLSATLTAPSSRAQTEVIQKAWKDASIDPTSISYIEAHGTGTKLGDPIEIEGIDAAFKPFTSEKAFCAISAVKSNIGHTNTAAGLAGLIKVVLSLKNRKLFPSVHFEEPNPFIPFEESAVYVNHELKDWPKPTNEKRRAGVSSFGLIGTNCHVILEEAPPSIKEEDVNGQKEYLFPISAPDHKGLVEINKRLEAYLSCHEDLSLEGLSFTLWKGRNFHRFRHCYQTTDLEDLRKQLKEVEVPSQSENNSKRLVYVFSNGSAPDEKTIKKLLEKYSAFQKSMEECTSCKSAFKDLENFEIFSFQYAFYSLLSSKNLDAKSIISIGIGKLATGVVSGEIKLGDISESTVEEAISSRFSEDQLKTAIKDKYGGEYTVFAEVGEGNRLESLFGHKEPFFSFISINRNSSEDAFLSWARSLFLTNADIDWKEPDVVGTGKRIELPLTQFEKARCWLESSRKAVVNSWMYQLDWQETPSPPGAIEKGKTWLVFGKSINIEALAATCKEVDHQVMLVSDGSQFLEDQNGFTINYSKEEDYITLFDVIEKQDLSPDGIIYINDESSITVNQAFPIFFVCKHFSNWLGSNKFHFALATKNVQPVKSNGIVTSGSIDVGFIRALMSEYPQMNATHVDFAGKDAEIDFQTLFGEMFSGSVVRYSKHRDGNRLVPVLSKNRIESDEKQIVKFVNEGTYLVTGGAGGIGMEVCQTLANHFDLTFIILGRSNIMDPGAKDKRTALESLGKKATVKYISVDLADSDRMEEVFKDIAQSYPKIDVVIHAAGIPISRIPVVDKTKNQLDKELAAKVYGTINLDRFCTPLHPDCWILFSSLNSQFPQKNSTGYTMSNSFLDNYGYHLTLQGVAAVTINWPGWKSIGMSVDKERDNDEGLALSKIGTEEGIEAFFAALETGLTNVLVAPIEEKNITSNPFFYLAGAVAEELKSGSADEHSSTQTPTEKSVMETISDIWKDVLKAETIAADDDFFELGGHSLNGTQVINRIQKEFGVEIFMDDLYDYATLEEMSVFVESLIGELEEKNPLHTLGNDEIEPVEEQDHYPVSSSQLRLWYTDQIDASRQMSNVPMGYELKGELNAERLKEAFQLLVDSCESFRTVFLAVDGTPRQKVNQKNRNNFKFVFENISNKSDQKLRLQKHIAEETDTLFDLEKGPLIRARLIQLDDRSYIFLLTMHHIITDRWSTELIFESVKKIYNELSEGKTPEIPSTSIQYRDYAIWYIEHLKNEEKSGMSRNYWKEKFSNIPETLMLPIDFARAEPSFVGDTVLFEIDQENTKQIEDTCNRYETSLFMYFLTVTSILMNRYTGQQDFIIGTPVSGRIRAEIEQLVGYFINVIPLRISIDPEDTFEDFIGHIKRVTLESFQHQDYPLVRLLDDIKFEKTADRQSLFNVVLIVQNDIVQSKGSTQLSHNIDAKPFTLEYKTSTNDLRFQVEKREGRIVADTEYRTSLFLPETIDLINENLESVVRQVNENNRIKLKDIEISLDKGEEELINNLAEKFGQELI